MAIEKTATYEADRSTNVGEIAMSKETAVKIKKGEQAATELNRAADRPERVNPSNREQVKYNVVEAHGVTNPDFTKDQTTRSHELVDDNGAIKAGASKPGTIGNDRSLFYETGAESAKRRAEHVLAKRKETEAIFDSHRKYAAKFPYAKNPKFKQS
jgi:hypothetical protein